MRLILLLIIVFAIIASLYFGGLKLKPGEADLDDWKNFIVFSIIIVTVISYLTYLLYDLVFYKSVKLRKPEDVFKLRKPWIACLYGGILVAITISLLLGWKIIPDKSVDVIIHIIFISIIISAGEFIIFMAFSIIFTLPSRARYIPFNAIKWRI